MLELIPGFGRAVSDSGVGILLTVVLLGPVALNLIVNMIRFRSGTRRSGAGASCAHPGFPRVSILIPARNEEHNLPRLLESIRRQTWTNREILVYDDGSEDETWEVICSHQAVTGVRGSGPPEGWYGKVHALHDLASRAAGDVYLFLDADTELRDPDALARMVAKFERAGGALVTGITHLKGRGHLVVSVIGYSILASIPWWAGKYLPSRYMAAVNGQCWMIDADLYQKHHPHRAVRSEVLEDVMIGRYMYSKGIRPALVDAQEEVSVHMYDSLAEAWLGFRKNAYAMVGGTPVSALALWGLFTGLYVLLPLVFMPAFVAVMLLKFGADRYLGVSPLVSLATPLSFVLASVLILDSAISTENGTAEWKGRRLVPRGAGG